MKRRKGCQQYPEQNKDEQAISVSSLNRLVGAVEVYDLEVEQFDCVFLYSEFGVWYGMGSHQVVRF